MSFIYPTCFFDVWDAIASHIRTMSAFSLGLTKGSRTITPKWSYFNEDPELRNRPGEDRYPAIVLTTIDPVPSRDWVVQEEIKCLVAVTAAAPYLEGMKADTIALADGQTLEITRGFYNGTAQDEEVLMATFSTGQFADITQATPAEVAAVLNALSGVSANVPTGNTVRITHDDASSYSYMQVTGGTAAALKATFPAYEVQGRDAGEEQQVMRPASHYDYSFQLGTLAKRPDNHGMLKTFVESLFRQSKSPIERGMAISTKTFEVMAFAAVGDPLVEEGAFATTYPFTLKRIPMSWDAAQFEGDNFNGGNYDGTGINPRAQAPVVATFEIGIDQIC